MGINLRTIVSLAIITVAWVFAVPIAAEASPVAFGFRGTVTNVFDGLATLNDSIVPGTPFWGAYVFESTTPNSAPLGGEGDQGLYHHERRPAGIYVHVGGTSFFSKWGRPDLDVIVNNDFGFAGADEYGFFSHRNRSFPQLSGDALTVSWMASTFTQQVFDSADLPLDPPDLSLLGGGVFQIYGECTPCAAPAAFYRITGPVTALVELPRADWWHRFSSESVMVDRELTDHQIWHAFAVPEPNAWTVLTMAGLWLAVKGARCKSGQS